MWCRIKFLGVWDTVAALGLPFRTLDVLVDKVPIFRNRFQDFRLSKSVENAYHALAIDDERRTFHPVLWDAECEHDQTVEQVWFCGMHTDVGGGYEETGEDEIWTVTKRETSPADRHARPLPEPDPEAAAPEPVESARVLPALGLAAWTRGEAREPPVQLPP